MLLLYIVAFIILDYANGDNTKGSLTFVIDDTGSMHDDIKQVKEKTDQIFDAVLNSNASKIKDFIIVTFNDPGAKLCTVTKDRDVFKKTLAEIKVDGGGDCQEYAMKGIELALEESKPNSFFYVFTEAAAKDYKEYERIKILALKKSIQVTFLITGECGNIPWENNAVYGKLAAATNGQVCHIEKQDVRKIIEYIIASIKHKKTTLAEKYFDNALKHNFRFHIDSKVWDVIISVSGVNPTYHITDTDGNKVETKEFIDTEKSHISKLDAKSGVYTVHFNSIGEVSAVITGSTSVGFQHGFSTDQPSSLNETSNKSIAGLPVYVSIALDNIDKDVSLETIEIRDIDNNFISEFPLTLIDKNKQFYVTQSLLMPNSTFKLAINGQTENKEKITRVASTTIKPQKPMLKAPKLKAPTVTILEGAKIIAEYDKSMTLKCKVNAFPKPDIIWQDNLETVYSFTIVPVDLPYEYMSILKIDKINKNVTIHCTAVNLMGENSKHITIETKRNPFIKVIGFPKDTTLEYGAPAELNFKVEAFPQVKITWYINGKQIKNNNDYEVSSDGLIIKQMRKELKGNYTVEAYNEEERKKQHFKIDISGVIPVIDKSISEYRAEKGSNVNISCRIIKSKPSPLISWTFKQEGFETSVQLKEVTETLHLKNVGLKQIGTYTCLAHNEFGRDFHVVDLFVEYSPIIEKVETQVKVPEGDSVNLHCKVDGSPLPLVRWLFNEVEINNTEKYVYNNNSISFTGTIEDNGIYTCEAINSLGKAVKAFYVTIFIIPVIDKNISDYRAERGSDMNISCRILKSKPSPVISWTFKQEGFETSVPLKEVTETLHLKNVGLKQIGMYTCLAYNDFGRDSHVVDLFVEYAPTIEKVETQVKIPEGDLVNLHCKVDGSPLPLVRWLFNEVEIINTGKYIYNATSLSFTGSIEDDGIYTCEASNSLGGAVKHFYVTTFTPVSILANPLGATTYDAVQGDLALRIPCNAIGSPKPVVTWQTNSSYIASGTDWFDIKEDGTLTLKYPTLNSSGSYTCRASNDFSSDLKEFTVNVTPYPKLGYLTATLNLEIGTSHHVECDLPHRHGDIVNWFKNGQIITSGELYLTKLTTQDSGVYSCRVSTFISAQTLHKNITVGYKPIFIKEEDINIDLVEETFAYLDCSAYGVPTPQIIWKHNGNFVKTSDMDTSYIFEIKPDVIGIYECVVSNIFGNINRTFNIKNTKEAPELKEPTVTILEGAKIIAEYDKSMTLKCKVNAFPKPDVTWQDNLETVYSFTTVPVDRPYEYMSILKIEKVKKNVTIYCTAVNLMGENSKHITIETKRNHFIKVIGFPKDTTLEYGAQAELNFKVEAFPQVKITWYINGKQIKNNNDYEVSSDGLIIKQMRKELKGNYTVEAYNEEERKKQHFKIDISGVIPVIDKSISEYRAEKGSNVNISCRIIKSKPSPLISWTFKQEGFETSVQLKEVTETLHLKNVGLKQIGTYTCLAHNEFGRDFHVVDLFVEYSPIIEKVETQVKVPEGDSVNLHCKVDGSPLPLVRWLFNEVEINNTEKYVYNNNSISFTGTIEDNGIYTCEAINSLGKAVKDFYVTIFITPVIDKSINDYKAEKGSNVNISCRILKSKPSPFISWTFKQEGFETSVHLKEVTETLHLKNVGIKQNGTYTCLAHNEFGRDSHVVDLFVEYSPTIEKVETQVKVPEGDSVNLHCKVDGSPKPLVRWLFNEVEINNTEKYVYNNNSISFTGTIEDNGIYTCEAINSLGKAVKAFYVTIFITPVIDKSINDYKAEKGSNVNISCRILKSKPSPFISWTFKQEGFETSVHLKEVTETLHLKNVGIKQNGTYTCLAHNEFGRDSHVVDLFVEYSPTIEKVETQVKVPEGDSVNLHCKVDGSPKPLVRWLFNEVEINNTEKYVYNNNSISFTGTIEDNGIYTCEAINSLGKAVKDFYVTIFITPVIDKSINDYKAEKGSNVNISCRILKSKPSPFISWTFKQEGFETSVHLKEVTETLHLKNVGLKQNGTYTCLAHNEFGRDSHVVDLFVEYSPTIEKVETQVKVPEGDSVNLHCKVDGSPKPLVRWLFNEVEINNTEKYVYNNNSISFTGTIEDNGIYTCEAINSLGKAVKAFYVTIFITPVIDKSINDYKAEKGSNVNISCRILKSKPSPLISWTFKQEGFETSVHLKEVTETLHLKNVGIKQNGTYTCLAHNEFGRDSHVVDLFVEYSPTIEKVETQVKVPEGDSVNLHCKVDGSPKPLVRWLFNEVEINNTEKYVYNKNSISFTGTIEDNGIYTCKAINSLGKAVKAFYVTIFITPVIDKSINDYKAEKGSNVNISCRILKSKPSPLISWTFKQEGFETSVHLKEVTETLHLKNVGIKQNGTYTCLAHNEFGRDSHVVDLFVEYSPTIEKVETQVKVPEGDSVNLHCKVDGSPKPLVRWLFNEVEINNTEKYVYNKNSISFTGTIEDNGIYTCKAINSLGKAVKAFYVTIFITPVIDKSINDYKAEKGSNVNISCRILKSKPSPLISWTFKQEGFETSVHLKEVTETLHLKNVGIKQNGTYTCLAHNEFGRDSHVVDLFVEYSPTIEKVETQVKVPEGDSVNLHCKVDGSPKPLVRWLFNEVEINNTEKYVYNNNSISFTGKIEDNGIYTCEAINSLGKAVKAFYVTIFITPVIDKSINDYKAEKGSNVNISCRILKSKPSPLISWTFKQEGFETSVHLKEVTETLHLKNVGIKQNGTYTCLAHNEFGRDSHVVDLFVEYSPTIEKVETQVKVPEGDSVNLHCKVDGSPKPLVRWLFNEVEINNTEKYVYNKNSISFTGTIEDNGIYTCKAINSLGKAVKAFYVTIFITPVIDKSINDYKAEKGSNVNISCRILKSKPSPLISWTFKQEGFETSVHLEEVTETLHLKNVGIKQNGTYTCLAHNEFGRDSHVVDLFVEYSPTIEKVQTQVKVPEGDSVNLHCKVDGSPKPLVRWLFNEVEINNTEKYVYNKNSISFTGTIEDNGIYTCKAINSLGKAVKAFYVTIFITPVIDKSINDYKAEKGSNVNISCRILKSKPSPLISWTFKQEGFETSVHLEEVTETLHLKNVGIKQNGSYTCLAHNEFGRDSHVVDLFVEYSPTIEKVETQVKVPEGDSVNLHCKVDGSPKPLVRWLFNEVEINNTEKYVYNKNSISFTGTIENNGIYTCKAINSLGKAVKAFYVTIFITPVIDKSINDYKAEKGSNVNISCRILKSKPSPLISWTFKQEGFETSVHLEEVTETLHLKNVGIKQNGTYTCLAHNEFGRDSHVVDLFVEYSPTIEKVQTQVKVPEGDSVNLHCKVDGSPKPLVRWLFNEVEINNTEKYVYNKNSISFTGTIEDNGIYTCKAINSLGKAVKAFYVTIFITPVIDKSINDYKAEKGSNVNISCRILKSKPSPLISWTFKQEGFETSVHLEEVTETLHLKNVGIKQNGSYTCLAHNEFGRDSHVVDLFVEYSPTIEKVETQVKVPEGDSVNLHCKVDGSPKPLVRWLFNEVEINNTEKYVYNKNSISFTGTIENNGIYTCKAINSLGKAVKAFYVTIFITPVIDKSINDYKAEKGSNVNISCRILKSKPSPVISWTFKQDGFKTSVPLKKVTETLHLKNVGLNQIGIYTCLAHNEFGRDSHVVDLFVEYAPTIEKVKTQVKIVKGQLVILTCKVDGSPFPIVRWLFKEVEINNTGKYIFNANSLRFIGSIEDNGIYTCEAINSLGEAKKHFYVTTFIPTKMKIPKQSNLKLNVGVSVELECLVEGYPKPKVQWIFYSKNSSIPSKFLRAESDGTLSLEHVQVEDEGFYRCSASNVGGMKSITYEIHVRAPVSILANPLGATTYDAVQGDLALRIPCNAIGSPKPVVTWETDGYKITSGTDWFDIEEDGTLIINYPNLYSAGSYTCRASNYFSTDLKVFTVKVIPYPQLSYLTATLNLEIGSSHHVECDLPHRDGDIVNWFKDGKLITSGELYLTNLTIQDSGVYSCRVSTFISAQTLHKKVTVGCKPILINDEDINIDFIGGTFAYLDCSAYGVPKPQIIWKHNGNFVKTSDMDMSYIFEMTPDVIGSYECVVSNKFGNINRTFNIKNTKECLLDIDKDFNKHQPLLLSRSRQWPDLKQNYNFIRIPKSTHFLLSCPGNTVTYDEEEFGEYVKAICVDNLIFKIRDRNVDFSKLKCKEEIKSMAKSTNQSCFSGNTDLLRVGFSLKTNFLGVYDVCIDKDNKIPLFTRHNLHQGISGTLPKENFKFTGSKYFPFNFEDMYKCWYQLHRINLMTQNNLSSVNQCCFKKRQLVSPADVIPGLSQVATYNYLNVIPQWSTCGTENWDEIEHRIQSLVNLFDIKLKVFTGSSYPLRFPGQVSAVFLSDRFKRLQPVPMYIWKVVQNIHDKSSLAIIQLNVPKITLSEALSYMRCKDICDEVEWMKNDHWHDVDKGFTFCCSITEFASYYGMFIKGHDKVFKTRSLVSDHSLI